MFLSVLEVLLDFLIAEIHQAVIVRDALLDVLKGADNPHRNERDQAGQAEDDGLFFRVNA